jgi:hypothetical protein
MEYRIKQEYTIFRDGKYRIQQKKFIFWKDVKYLFLGSNGKLSYQSYYFINRHIANLILENVIKDNFVINYGGVNIYRAVYKYAIQYFLNYDFDKNPQKIYSFYCDFLDKKSIKSFKTYEEATNYIVKNR